MIDAIVSGFYTKLSGDAALQTKLGGSASDKKIYNILASQDASLPYITFGLETDRPIGIFGSVNEIEDLTFWVNCFSSTGQKNCREIADLVLAVMDDASLTVTGYTAMKCTREFIGSPIYLMDIKVWQIPLRVRVWLSK